MGPSSPCPESAGVSFRVSIPGLAQAATIEQRASAILNALGGGEITVDEFQRLFAALAHFAAALKVGDLAEAVRELQEHAGLRPRRGVVVKPVEPITSPEDLV